MKTALFSPFDVRGTRFKNRVVISPMCTYSAHDGIANEWHLTEAAAVEPRGRITHGDLGIWSADHAAALKPVTAFIRRQGALPAIQIAHAGRKASMQRPWHGNGPMDDVDAARGEMPWDIVAPSPEPVREGWLMPAELTVEDIHAIQDRYAAAAGHAIDAGFEVLEIHSAHGYLAHSFLSPISNRRNDAYGGDRAGRMRFTLETAEKVRSVWPDDRPLFVRISSVDADGATEGWQLEDSVALAGELKARGVDVVDCSSSGISGLATAALGKQPMGFRTEYSARIGREAGVATMVVGLILHAEHADSIVADGLADLVAIGREALYDPYWARHAAVSLGVDPGFEDWPEQYGWWLVRREKLLRDIGEAHVAAPPSGG
ncbi:MAG: NADH:flavin oxidoreductase/NADH oxidase [Alphaproteobacteria bacterium]|nr:NADH:flavin oxidoreductase/NADH oxidase [Alphaproteobacteria bacterium]